MAFQGISVPRGQVNQIAEIDGAKIVGTRIKAPFAIHSEVYVLPMDNVLATKVRLATSVRLFSFNCNAGYWRGHICPLRLT